MYRMPVQTKPLKMLNAVIQGPNYVYYFVCSSWIILRFVLGVLSTIFAMISGSLISSSSSGTPNFYLVAKLAVFNYYLS